MSIPGISDIQASSSNGDLFPGQDDPALASEFAGLTQFNVRIGLRRTQGDAVLYRRLLRKFLDGNADFEAAFLKAAKACDPRAAERLAHTLKGLAATIEAEPVTKAAALLERACREGGDASRAVPELDAVLACLHPCLDQLRAFFGDSVGLVHGRMRGWART